MTSLKVLLILIMMCLLAIFIAQNVAIIQMRFLVWDFFLSRALLVFFAFVAGFIIGWFSSGLLFWRKSRAEKSGENA